MKKLLDGINRVSLDAAEGMKSKVEFDIITEIIQNEIQRKTNTRKQ